MRLSSSLQNSDVPRAVNWNQHNGAFRKRAWTLFGTYPDLDSRFLPGIYQVLWPSAAMRLRGCHWHDQGFLPQCLWGTQQLKTLIYASCFPWTQAWSSVVWQEHFPPLAVSISWADAQPLQMFETKMPQVGHGGMARHNLQVKAVMVPLFFSATITANVPRWSQMYPDVTRIPGWQAQAPLEKTPSIVHGDL